MSRTFEAKPAKREATPIIMAVVSPSGAGKTKSALRLADGFARVTPGPTVVIDSEAKRALHHSDSHKFMHVDFSPPFSPVDYISAFKEALRHNPATIIVDSISHEWEGPGGILEMHDEALKKKAGDDEKKRERNNMSAWIRPKAEHNKMKQFILQQRVNWILCFRAKEKIKPVKGGEPIDLGWQALGADDLIYECLLKCLLFPGADGKPTWRSDKMGEQALMKLPGWFRDLFAVPRQLDESIGEQIARWAAGGDVVRSTATPDPSTMRVELAERFDACSEYRDFVALEAEMRADWERIPRGSARTRVTEAFKAAKERCQPPVRSTDDDEPPPVDPDEAAEIARRERSDGA